MPGILGTLKGVDSISKGSGKITGSKEYSPNNALGAEVIDESPLSPELPVLPSLGDPADPSSMKRSSAS